jgi:cell volume regulation protein A
MGGFMNALTLGLLVSSVVIILCILCNKISNKAGIPMLVAFIFLGMLFGSDGIVKIPFENFQFAEGICSFALIFIMFYGGFGTKWSEAKSVAGRSLLLSSVGVVVTGIITGIFCTLVLNFSFLEGMLVGSVLGSTDAASVFSILRSKKLNLKNGTASILEIESGSNDPFSYMMTIIILAVMDGSQGGKQLILLTLSQLLLGILLGGLVAYLGELFLRKVWMEIEGFAAIFVLAIAVLGYALPTLFNGNGYLSVYIVGIYLGNSKKIPNKKELVHFFNGITALMQVAIFFILGLLALPSQMPKLIPVSIAIALFLTFFSRPLAVFGILKFFPAPRNQKLLISWAGLRGASSIVFAILAVVSKAYTKSDIFHIVFIVVLFSITLQGSLIPLLAKKLGMIDQNSDVMRTFNDYTEENEIQFIKINIETESDWKNKTIKEISVPPNTLISMIIRKNRPLVPNGNTKILESDAVILCAQGYHDDKGIRLKEMIITKDHPYVDKKIVTLQLEEHTLILVIKRNQKIIVPTGQTKIHQEDVLVVNQLLDI